MATHYFASHRGGVEVVADRLFHAFSSKGHEVRWLAGDLTPPPTSLEKSSGIGLRTINLIEDKTGLPLPIPTLEAIRTIEKSTQTADILMLHDSLYLTNIAAFLAAKRRGVPIVIVQHVGAIPFKSPIASIIMRIANRLIARPMLSHADQVIFIGEETQKHFTQIKYKRKPQLIFSGVDTDLHRCAKGIEEKLMARRKFNIPTDKPALLYVGRFVPNKGIPALKIMASERPQWSWIFAGRGLMNPREWSLPNVHVHENLPDKELAELFRACDLFVMPSRYEAFSLAVREALASGLQVVCTSDVSKSDKEINRYIKTVNVESADNRTAQKFLVEIDESITRDTGQFPTPQELSTFAASRYSWNKAVDKYLGIMAVLLTDKTTA